ncbi:permease-like cell division protein FtsX [Microaerobacter geothermalis]|uniref:permease-like cell division protein FtsX n=1 Tax=Microaerobacter geothermalis TaxID=674972 RepID=UPI001F2E439E|nr:permease-like cell division protein FtsX [Microaerobacter geothermalis]MCF6094551.1 permease-like cell division protein FtsX [Microaerobacter geothermalis]
MKLRSFGRHLREGVKNIGRNGWMTFASVSAVSITLFILGVFLMLALNVNHIVDVVENRVEIKVFLDVMTDEENIKSIKGQLKDISGVKEVQFVPKEEGLQQLKDSFGEQAYLFDGLEQENPLPDAFVVRIETPQEVEQVAGEIQRIPLVDKVNYGQGFVDKLFTVTSTIRNIGLIFIIGLAFTAMFLIANTIRLTIFARRKEIEIMKLVGATNWFIRWPFFIEGLLLGVIGSILPIILLLAGYKFLYDQVMVDLSFYFLDLLPLFPLGYQIAELLIGIGAFIGIWGSLVSVHRFLRV